MGEDPGACVSEQASGVYSVIPVSNADQVLEEVMAAVPGADVILASIWSELSVPTCFPPDFMHAKALTSVPIVSPVPMHVDDMIPLDSAALRRGLYIAA